MDETCDHKLDSQTVSEKEADEQSSVTLVLDEGELTCQKEVLCSNSEYFQAMFHSNMLESNQTTIKLHDVKLESLEILVEASKTGLLSLSMENVQAVLSTATMFQFSLVIKKCDIFLRNNLADKTCLTVMSLSDMYALNNLYNKSKAYCLLNFDSVVRTSQFLESTQDSVIDYLSEKHICTNSELNIFKAIVRWVKHCEESRKGALATLLQCLDEEALTEEEIREIQGEKLIQSSEKAESVIERLHKNYGSTEKCIPRGPPRDILLLVGDIEEDPDNKAATLWIYQFQESEKKFVPLSEVPSENEESNGPRRIGYKACVVGTTVYITGGETQLGRNKWHYDVWSYDTTEHTWRIATRLASPRRHHSVCVIGKCFFIAGGFGRHRVVQNTVEKFDTGTDEWTSLPRLITPVFSAAMCACSDDLYIIKHEIQHFHSKNKQWTTIQLPLPFEIGIQCAVTYARRIYIIGSYILKLIEFNTRTSQLTELGKFENVSGIGCVYDNKIYVIGGKDVGVVELYDLQTRQFSTVLNISGNLSNSIVLTVPVFPKFR